MSSGKKYPPVVVVDERDNEVGSAMLAEVWRHGLWHRVVSIYVVDDRERLLLQFRAPTVKIYPNCWDPAAGGHVDAGCSYDQAAAAELAEELGIRQVALKVLGTFHTNTVLEDGRIINQFERVYLARVPHDIALRPEQEEIRSLRWFTAVELTAEIARQPVTFTPGLLYGLKRYFPEFCSATAL